MMTIEKALILFYHRVVVSPHILTSKLCKKNILWQNVCVAWKFLIFFSLRIIMLCNQIIFI